MGATEPILGRSLADVGRARAPNAVGDADAGRADGRSRAGPKQAADVAHVVGDADAGRARREAETGREAGRADPGRAEAGRARDADVGRPPDDADAGRPPDAEAGRA